MKRILLLTALFVSVSLRAAVIDIDLSKAASYSTAGSAELVYADGELTVNWAVTSAWEVTGIKIPLRSMIGITALQFEYCGDASSHAFLHYLADEQGTFWWDPNGWFSLASTEWQSASLTPSTALWSEPAYEYGTSPMLSLHFVANPETAASGSFKIRNVRLITSGDTPVTPDPEGQSQPLIYNGEVLPIDTTFVRTQCGAISASHALPEISGIAASRRTPGYIWMQSDETDADTNPFIIATDETGTTLGAHVSFDHVYRWDWEDMCAGVYNGTNYLFIGAFGDNNHTDGNYCIIWFEEPAIDPANPNVSVQAHRIKFAYPDGKYHNCEALMYDNLDQTLYLVTKVYYDVCQVYSLPFSTTYGDTEQTLTYVCDLGVKSDIGEGPFEDQTLAYKGFHLVTAADITPDGKHILIKNHNNLVAIYTWTLYWERQGTESLTQTLRRQPKVIDCYQYEWQGEAIAWLDNNTFYTTSDSDAESQPPIYKYTRQIAQGIETIQHSNNQNQLVILDHTVYIRSGEKLYTIDGRLVR